MTGKQHIVLAHIALKEGVDEATLIAASDAFQADFAGRQPGIVRRILLRTGEGRYADLVFFASRSDAERVIAAEAESPACAAYFSIMRMEDRPPAASWVMSFDPVKTYE